MTTLSTEVAQFISAHIHSLEQLEVLLLLHRDPSRSWTAQQINSAIQSSLESITSRVQDLVHRGFIEQAAEGQYRYAPSDPETDRVIGEVANTYRASRIRIVEWIFNAGRSEVQSFADAFRFKPKGGTRG